MSTQPFNLDQVLATPIADPLDEDIVNKISSEAPFVKVDGLVNSRWLPSPIKPNYILRSGTLEQLTEQGKADIQALGIETIFDLRSSKEIEEFPDPEIEGVELVLAKTVPNPASKQAKKYESLVDVYINMLDSHTHVWAKLLEHVRDHPDRPFLLHCTAGKDRTGVASILLLSLAGAPAADIARDYAFTRIGAEPARELLTSKINGGKDPSSMSPENQKAIKVFGSFGANIAYGFLEEIEHEFGSVQRYVREELEFGAEDVGRMYRNLRSGS